MRICRCIVAVAVLAGPLSGPALGQQETDEALAERYYKLGEGLYHRSDYEGALKQFEESYKHSKKPALLFNIARCYESLGRHEEAIEAFEGYLASKPPNADQVEARVANLRKLVVRKQQEQRAREEAERKRREAQQQKAAAGAASSGAQPPPAKRGSPLVGWIVAGGGAALLATGVVFGILAAGKASGLEDAAADQQPYALHRDDEDTGETFQAVQVVTLIAGGAALATGAVLLTLHYLKGREAAANESAGLWIAPAITPRGGYVTAGIRF